MRGYPFSALLCATFFVVLSSYLLPLVQGAALATPVSLPTPIITEASPAPTGTLVFNLGRTAQNGTTNGTTGKPASNTGTRKLKSGDIAGIIIGIIVLLIFFGLILRCIRRRKDDQLQVEEAPDLYGGVEQDFRDAEQEGRVKDDAAEQRRLENKAMRKEKRERDRANRKEGEKKKGGAWNSLNIFGGSGATEVQKEKAPMTEDRGGESRKWTSNAFLRQIVGKEPKASKQGSEV